MPKKSRISPQPRPLKLLFLVSIFLYIIPFLAACGRPQIGYISDPAWSGAFSASSREYKAGLAQAGYQVRDIKLDLSGLPSSLSLAIEGYAGKTVALSPLLGSEIQRLSPAFPEKTFILPGVSPEGEMANSYLANSDYLPGTRLMGQMAARVLGSGAVPLGKGKKADAAKVVIAEGDEDIARPLFFAAALLPLGESGDALEEAFRAGFSEAAPELAQEMILVRRIRDDRAEAESAVRELSSFSLRFLYIAAFSSAPAALDSVPPRGWVVAGQGLGSLDGIYPSLAASLENDWRALARSAASRAQAAGAARESLPAKIFRLKGDREGIFSKFPRLPSVFSGLVRR